MTLRELKGTISGDYAHYPNNWGGSGEDYPPAAV